MQQVSNINKIVSEFKDKRPLYVEFGKKLNKFFNFQLKQIDIKDALIKNRAKSIKSFREKITRPGKNYSDPLNDIKDFTGLRIIVLYTDQIPRIEEIIEREFLVDVNESVDKSKGLKPDTFGYLSMHYIVAINSDKEIKLEWKKFKGLTAEIQVRTHLQDAWAMVSHALQYKRESDVPDNLKRKLNRLAGLFELADEQFKDIKNDGVEIMDNVKKQLREGKYDKVEINFLSISSFLSTSTLMREAINIANTYKILGNRELLEHYNIADCSFVIDECLRLGIKTIESLNNLLENTEQGNNEFIQMISEGKTWKVTKGFILFLLIIKAEPSKFNPEYLIEKYNWDYIIANSIIDLSFDIKRRFNY